jgi:acetylglutamate kinase
MASEIATELSAYYNIFLFFCFEKKGVLVDEKDETSMIYELDYEIFERYKEAGIISAGMIPKLENGFRAKRKGVKEVLITNAMNIATGRGTRLI